MCIKVKQVDTISRRDLRSMSIGSVMRFALPGKESMLSSRSNACCECAGREFIYRMRRISEDWSQRPLVVEVSKELRDLSKHKKS